MAKVRNDVPPGGEDKGMFEGTSGVSTSATEVAPPVQAIPPEPIGPKTTRGMNRVLKAADSVWKELKDLEPSERQWVWLFIMTQFPDLSPSGGTK